MRGRRWLLMATIGCWAGWLAGCLRAPSPIASLPRRANAGSHAKPTPHCFNDAVPTAAAPVGPKKKSSPPPSDYLVSTPPTVKLDVLPAAVESADKPAKPMDMRIASEEQSLPPQPADPPQPRREMPRPLPPRVDAPAVQVLRAFLEHHGEEEINEQLAGYDTEQTRETMRVLLSSAAVVEQNGGIARLPPRDLATWLNRLNHMSADLRGRAQLVLERMCFCSRIRNFGDLTPLSPEQGCVQFHSGEEAHVYVEVRNFSCRRLHDRYLTAMKVRVEIYDDSNRQSPPIAWTSPLKESLSTAPRQDNYINVRVQVPMHCPAGLHTLRISVEDWTDVPPGVQHVPEWRIAQRTLDFRVVGATISAP